MALNHRINDILKLNNLNKLAKIRLFIVTFIISLIILSDFSIAQDYSFSLNQRRRYDRINVEVWVKAISPTAPKLGYAYLKIKYDSLYLKPIPNLKLSADTILPDFDLTKIVVDVNSSFNNINGYSVIATSIDSANSTFNIILKLKKRNELGIIPSLVGNGSLIGVVEFGIYNKPKENSITGINWSDDQDRSSLVFDIDSTETTEFTEFTKTSPFTVIGVTMLTPKLANSIIDRDKLYKCLNSGYVNLGYPIYYERSVDTSIYKIPTKMPPALGKNLGYSLEYTTDSGAEWYETGRFLELDINIGVTKSPIYMSGAIALPLTAGTFITTTQRGEQITMNNFREPIRVLWEVDSKTNDRAEQIKLRLTQIKGNFGTNLVTWEKTAIQDTSKFRSKYSRLFFAQLNGTDEYFKTQGNFSNATQLTVEAWINLTSFKAVGSEVGVIASSGGEEVIPIFGSKEGSWMLYLKDGKYPAFRVRELLARGNNGYLAELISYYPLRQVSSDSLENIDFERNWVYLSATVNNNVVKLYVNGELVDWYENKQSMDARMLVTNHPIWIGINPNDKIDANDYFHGGIKSVRVYRTALTQAEIRARAAMIVEPSNVTGFEDLRRALQMYYKFQGDLSDEATNIQYQNGQENLDYYKVGVIENTKVNFRPDLPHIKLTSPIGNEGILNNLKDRNEIRWITYEIGDFSKLNSRDVEIEYSIDSAKSWYPVRDSAGRDFATINAPDAEKNIVIWEPYQNNVSLANLRSISPYSKHTLLRIRGTLTNNQNLLMDTSKYFQVAPNFVLQKEQYSDIVIPSNLGMNLIQNEAVFEMWIRPFRFPTEKEEFFPLIAKVSPDSLQEHYSIRLLPTGQIQFNVATIDGSVKTALSDIKHPVIAPNSIALDSVWTHIVVYFKKNDGNDYSEVRFYIDGVVQRSAEITNQLGTNLKPNFSNGYPTYIGSYPKKDDKGDANGFLGEIREIRFWEGVPNNFDLTSAEPNDYTRFVQGSQSIKANDLNTENRKNLYAVFTFDGGTFNNMGINRMLRSSNDTNIYARFYNDGIHFRGLKPYIKLVEPIFKQKVSNKTTDLYVRWVGFNYNGTDFGIGESGKPPFLEFSLLGGGGTETQPYQYVGSRYFPLNAINSLTLPDSIIYRFNGTGKNVYYAGSLNVSMADPDLSNDGIQDDQGAISATLTNARFRITGKYSYLVENISFQNEGPLFTITPATNFTIRVLPEGYHKGKLSDSIRNLKYNFTDGGLKIKLFKDLGGSPGALIDSSESFEGYTDLSPANLDAGNNKFANVNFVFTNIVDDNYWVLVEHKNHLPILSRFPVTYKFTGDDENTFRIESGWDFLSWNGVSENVLVNRTTDPWSGGFYSAFGYSESNKTKEKYAETALIFNSGIAGDTTNAFAAMVGGDVNLDGIIDSLDRTLVRQLEMTTNFIADITGDGIINADDRTIADRNRGKKSSVADLGLPLSKIETPNPDIQILDNISVTSNINASEKNNKVSDKLQANISYTLTGEIKKTSTIIDLDIYLQSNGDDFALGNCTFAVKYNPVNLTFRTFTTKADMLYHNKPLKGYYNLRTSPTKGDTNAVKGVQTIEIDYDAFNNLGGEIVPKTKYYIATLKFDLKNNSIVTFDWDKSTSVHSTNKQIVTDYGTFEKIKPFFQYTTTITSPNGGEEYRPDLPVNITWTSTGTAYVDLQFSSNGGSTWTKINSEKVPINSNLYKWTAPNRISDNCLIRIVDFDSQMELDISNAEFKIIDGFAILIRPSSSDAVYVGGENIDILWNSQGYNFLKFEYSTDAGKTWKNINAKVAAKNKTLSFKAPFVTTKEAIIKMSDTETGKELARSGEFRIMSGSVTFSSPNATTLILWTAGSPLKYTVRWNAVGVDTFDLQFSSNGGSNWITLVPNINAKQGIYSWNVPQIKTNDAYIRAIWKSDDTFIYGETGKFIIDEKEKGIVEELPDGYFLSEIFPNPTRNYISFSLKSPHSEKCKIIISDIDGKEQIVEEINSRSDENNFSMNLTNLPIGQYIIRFEFDEYIIIKKILKI